MESFLKIILYYAVLAIFYLILKWQFKKFESRKGKKITIWQILMISLSIGLYSVIGISSMYTLDHGFYARRFVNGMNISWDSVGLNAVFDIVRIFTHDPYILNFIVNLLVTIGILVIYRKWDDFSLGALMIFLTSEYFFYGFETMKQSPANILSLCAIFLFLKGKKIMSVPFVISAILFHETAVILIPIFLMLLLANKKWAQITFGALLAAAILFYVPVMNFIVQFLSNTSLSEQVGNYIGATGSMKITINFFTALKGIPLYTILITGLVKRKKYKDEIGHYDQYLVLVSIASTFTILSIYNYWMFRIACIVLIPCFIFSEKLLQNTIQDRKKRFVYKSLTTYMVALLGLKYIIQMFIIFGGL